MSSSCLQKAGRVFQGMCSDFVSWLYSSQPLAGGSHAALTPIATAAKGGSSTQWDTISKRHHGTATAQPGGRSVADNSAFQHEHLVRGRLEMRAGDRGPPRGTAGIGWCLPMELTRLSPGTGGSHCCWRRHRHRGGLRLPGSDAGWHGARWVQAQPQLGPQNQPCLGQT